MTAIATVDQVRELTAPDAPVLIALNRPQLEAAHAKMITFVQGRRARLLADMDEERQALEIAIKNKWAVKRHHAALDRMSKKVTFWDKIEAALNDGFVILPNFELNVFAIRTDAKKPRGAMTNSRYQNNFFQTAKLLPAGKGRYVSPAPTVMEQTSQISDGKGGTKELYSAWPTTFDDVDFPVVMAKPALMTAAGNAMTAKVFDEIGVAVDSRHSGRRSGDPVLIGRIRNPSGPDVSFYLGWYFDPSEL
jgi:hypothetical protein